MKEKQLSGKEREKNREGQCNCKRSQCVKKYCDCFNSGKACGENCNCEGCKNQENNEKID